MHKKKRAAILAASAIFAVLATGCAADASAPKTELSTLEAIKERGVLEVGMSATYKPWEYMKGKEIIGYDPDLIAILAEDLGVEPKMIDTDWTGVIPAFYADKFDVIISAMTVSPDRAKRVLFTQPYAVELDYFLTKDPNIKTQKDVEGKLLAAALADTRTEVTEEWAADGHVFPPMLLLPSEQEAILALEAGRADAAIIGYASAYQHAQDNPGYHIIPTWGPLAYTAIAVRQGDEELCHALNDKVGALKESGELAELFEKWFNMPPSEDPSADELPYEVC